MDAESYTREYCETHSLGPYLQEHHKSYLAMAWVGYQQMGRGFVVFDFARAVMDTNGAIVDMPVEYLTADELIAKKSDIPMIVQEAHRVASRYDPEAEMAFCHIFPSPYPLGDLPSVVALGINGTFPIKQVYEEMTAK
jgi:hypothetical protein